MSSPDRPASVANAAEARDDTVPISFTSGGDPSRRRTRSAVTPSCSCWPRQHTLPLSVGLNERTRHSPEPLKEHASQPVLLIETRGSQCRWIEGAADAEALCCGALTDRGSWCSYHRGRVFDHRLVDGDRAVAERQRSGDRRVVSFGISALPNEMTLTYVKAGCRPWMKSAHRVPISLAR